MKADSPRLRCRSCGRLVYPFDSCRNGMCELFRIVLPKAVENATEREFGSVGVFGLSSEVLEHPATTAARTRIRQVLAAGTPDARAEFGLTIVLIAQELGYGDLAELLIADFGLAEMFKARN